jgi:NADPH-dependent 2,4-dienoyl-CoA reductase/sulfur reductase-like enzyme
MVADPVIVVGAGPAGVRAAARLVAGGQRPIVLDEADRSGGQIYRRQPAHFTRPPEALYGSEAGKATALHAAFDALRPGIDYRPNTLAWGLYGGALLSLTDNAVARVPYRALILASGATDRIMPLPGWTVPGVFSLGGAQIALKAQACAIGARPVFLGTGPLLYLVAYQYKRAGVAVQAVLDTSRLSHRIKALGSLLTRPGVLAQGLRYTAWLLRAGVEIHTGVTPLAVDGEERVSGVRIRLHGGREQYFACDAVGLGYGLRSETQLADLAGCQFAFDPVARQWLPEIDADGRSTTPYVYLAGDGAMIRGADAAELSGRLAACAALRDLGEAVTEAELDGLRRQLAPMSRFRRGLEQAFPWPARLAAGLPDATVVCRCEAITAGDLRHAATTLEAPEVNRAKALSRVGMGSCQGRMCGLAAAEIVAAARGVDLAEVGRLRGQAPLKPLPISVTVP